MTSELLSTLESAAGWDESDVSLQLAIANVRIAWTAIRSEQQMVALKV